jgi:hypothetical protein|tara:strand:+ start:1924 stop:2274 length:351 start_codon:yes stop_codon:yes gene_type:complete
MSDCVYCEADAGKNYDVCMDCRNKRNVVTLGNKPVGIYIKKILELGMEHNTIIVKTLASNVNVFNYHLKPLFEYWGLEEYKRKWVKEQGTNGVLDSLHITMELIPSLRGIKTDKKR